MIGSFFFLMKTHKKSTYTSTLGIISEIGKLCLSVSFAFTYFDLPSFIDFIEFF